MSRANEIPIEQMKLRYVVDCANGLLLYRRDMSIAGSKHGNGYTRIKFMNRQYLIHRIIWAYQNGPIRSGYEIDHINGIRTDNRISNLREVSNSEQKQNTAVKKNATGLQGVKFNKRTMLYTASISINGKKTQIGSFKTPDDAHKAYCEKKKELHSFWNSSRVLTR